MILDHLDNAQRYVAIHPGFWKAFRYLRDLDPQSVEDGKHTIDGGRLFVIIASDSPRGQANAVLESHQKYIDIQYTISGAERIGWLGASQCTMPDDYDASKDLRLYRDRPGMWVDVPQGHFAVFYPEDLHAPLAGETDVRKAVVKIAIDW